MRIVLVIGFVATIIHSSYCQWQSGDEFPLASQSDLIAVEPDHDLIAEADGSQSAASYASSDSEPLQTSKVEAFLVHLKPKKKEYDATATRKSKFLLLLRLPDGTEETISTSGNLASLYEDEQQQITDSDSSSDSETEQQQQQEEDSQDFDTQQQEQKQETSYDNDDEGAAGNNNKYSNSLSSSTAGNSQSYQSSGSLGGGQSYQSAGALSGGQSSYQGGNSFGNQASYGQQGNSGSSQSSYGGASQSYQSANSLSNSGASQSYGQAESLGNSGDAYQSSGSLGNSGQSYGSSGSSGNSGQSYGSSSSQGNAGQSYGSSGSQGNAGQSYGSSGALGNAGQSYGSSSGNSASSYGSSSGSQGSAGQSYGDSSSSSSGNSGDVQNSYQQAGVVSVGQSNDYRGQQVTLPIGNPGKGKFLLLLKLPDGSEEKANGALQPAYEEVQQQQVAGPEDVEQQQQQEEDSQGYDNEQPQPQQQRQEGNSYDAPAPVPAAIPIPVALVRPIPIKNIKNLLPSRQAAAARQQAKGPQRNAARSPGQNANYRANNKQQSLSISSQGSSYGAKPRGPPRSALPPSPSKSQPRGQAPSSNNGNYGRPSTSSVVAPQKGRNQQEVRAGPGPQQPRQRGYNNNQGVNSNQTPKRPNLNRQVNKLRNLLPSRPAIGVLVQQQPNGVLQPVRLRNVPYNSVQIKASANVPSPAYSSNRQGLSPLANPTNPYERNPLDMTRNTYVGLPPSPAMPKVFKGRGPTFGGYGNSHTGAPAGGFGTAPQKGGRTPPGFTPQGRPDTGSPDPYGMAILNSNLYPFAGAAAAKA